MRVKKIILKNFIQPGVQELIFDDEQKLSGGNFYDFKVLPLLNDLFNGEWEKSIKSFSKYYPDFRVKSREMNLEMDALIGLDKDELFALNKISTSLCGKMQESENWYFSIKCIYPFIFPIVKLIPADKKSDQSFAIGTHYEKYFKSVVSKTDLLNMTFMNAVSQIRDLYFKYKKMPIAIEDLEEHKNYTDFLRAIYYYDDDFISKMTGLISQMDDGDIIHFGEQPDFFFRSKQFVDFFKQYPFLTNNRAIFEDFKEILARTTIGELDWVYSTKTPSNLIEIRKKIWDAYGTRSISTKTIKTIFKFDIKADKYLTKTVRVKPFVDSRKNPILFGKDDKPVNFFARNYAYKEPPKFDQKRVMPEFNISKKSVREQEKSEKQKLRTVQKNRKMKSIRV